MLDADRRLQRRLGAQARVAAERRDAAGESGESQRQRANGKKPEDRWRRQRGGRRQRKSRGQSEQREVDHGERRRPFAQERQARVDHAGADIEREGENRPGEAEQEGGIGDAAFGGAVRAVPVRKCAAAYAITTAMNAGRTMHFARQPRRAPFRCRPPRAGRPPEMEERGHEPRGGEGERQERAVEIEPGADRRRQQVEQRADLDDEHRDEEPLAGADQRREEMTEKRGFTSRETFITTTSRHPVPGRTSAASAAARRP